MTYGRADKEGRVTAGADMSAVIRTKNEAHQPVLPSFDTGTLALLKLIEITTPHFCFHIKSSAAGFCLPL